MIDVFDFFDDSEHGKASKITDQIYQGCSFVSKDYDQLVKLGITHILVAGNMLEEHFPKIFKYYTIPIDDVYWENIYPYFSPAFEFIEDCISKNGKILIHCAAGVSRSSSFTCSYLMMKKLITYEEAYKILKQGRPIAQPNNGFEKQLIELYEKEIKPKIKEKSAENSSKYSSIDYNKLNKNVRNIDIKKTTIEDEFDKEINEIRKISDQNSKKKNNSDDFDDENDEPFFVGKKR